MMQDGIVKNQETFDVEKIHQVYNGFANRLQDWMLDGISSTNDEGIRRNFIKLNTNADNCRISLHLSIQYHVILFYQPNYEVMKKQKELADFLTMTEKIEKKLAEKSDQVILKKLKDEGYKDLNPENLFEIFFKDDKIMENVTKEIDKQTDGDLNKIYDQKQSLLKELDNFLLEIYQIEPVLIDEARLVSGEEGFVFNLDVERINDEQSKQFSSDKISEETKKNITIRVEEILKVIK